MYTVDELLRHVSSRLLLSSSLFPPCSSLLPPLPLSFLPRRFYRTNHVRRFMLKRPFHRGVKDKQNEYKVSECVTVATVHRYHTSMSAFASPARPCTQSALCTQLPTASLGSCAGSRSLTLKW